MVDKFGKKFEEIIKRDFKLLKNGKITRLYDPVGGYFGVKNVCDFIAYSYPFAFYFEAKARKGNTFNLKELTQYEDLIEYADIKGLFPGVLIWFYEHNKIVWCSIKNIEAMKKFGIKSININHADTYDFELEIEINRIYPKINFENFYQQIYKKFKGLV